jgi:hypothetical protein
VLATPDGQETNKGNLHAGQRSKSVPSSVADIQPWAEATHADKHKGVQREQVCDEDVSTPCADHVSIEESCQASPHNASDLDGLDPQVEGEDQEEDSDGFVVVTTSDGS